MHTVVKVGRNAPELSYCTSWPPQNCHLASLGPKFTQVLPDLWSLATGTLIRGLVLNLEIVSRPISPSLTRPTYLYYDYVCACAYCFTKLYHS